MAASPISPCTIARIRRLERAVVHPLGIHFHPKEFLLWPLDFYVTID